MDVSIQPWFVDGLPRQVWGEPTGNRAPGSTGVPRVCQTERTILASAYGGPEWLMGWERRGDGPMGGDRGALGDKLLGTLCSTLPFGGVPPRHQDLSLLPCQGSEKVAN